MNTDKFKQAWQGESRKIIPFLESDAAESGPIQLNDFIFKATSDRDGKFGFRYKTDGRVPLVSDKNKWGNALARGFHEYFFKQLGTRWNRNNCVFEIHLKESFVLTMTRTKNNSSATDHV